VDFDKVDAVTAAESFAACVQLLGYSPVLLVSGQRERRHVFAWVSDLEHMAALTELAKKLSGDVRATIRPPGTPHRWDGDPDIGVKLLTPDTWMAALAALTSSDGRHISLEMWRVLVHGDGLQDRYGDDKDGPVQTAAWLRRVWADAVAYVESNPAKGQEHNRELVALQRWASTHAWTGKGGASEYLVYTVILARAIGIGQLTVGISTREIQKDTGLDHRGTVTDALTRLVIQGYIAPATFEEKQQRRRRSRKAPPPGRESEAWTLLIHRDIDLSTTEADAEVPEISIEELSADLWCNRGGLGKGVQRTYEVLKGAHRSTARQLTEMLGCSIDTTRKHLRALEEFGLAEHDQKRRWSAKEGDLDTLAAELGVDGRGERRHNRIDLERRGYHEYRTDWQSQIEERRASAS
jgi:hypothetical protein